MTISKVVLNDLVDYHHDIRVIVDTELPRNKNKALAHIQAGIDITDELLEACAKEVKLRPAIRAVRIIGNTLQGVATGIEDDDLGVKGAQALLSNLLETSISTVDEATVTMTKALMPIATTATVDQNASYNWEEGLKKYAKELRSDTPVDNSGQEKEKQLRNTLSKYRQQKTLLPVSIKTPFTLVELPIIPLFEDYTLMSKQNLQRLKIKNSNIAGFSVLERQYVLVFKKDTFKAKKTGKKVVRTKKSLVEEQANHMSNVQDIINLINEKSPVQFNVIGNKIVVNPENPKLGLMWLLPENKTRMLHQLSGSRGLKMLGWGFPWDIEPSDF